MLSKASDREVRSARSRCIGTVRSGGGAEGRLSGEGQGVMRTVHPSPMSDNEPALTTATGTTISFSLSRERARPFFSPRREARRCLLRADYIRFRARNSRIMTPFLPVLRESSRLEPWLVHQTSTNEREDARHARKFPQKLERSVESGNRRKSNSRSKRFFEARLRRD